MNKGKNTNRFRKIVRQLHLYLGLSTGLIVFIVAITGCCWVFKEEIESLTSQKFEIQSEGKTPITVTRAKLIAEKALPGYQIHGSLYRMDKNEPVEVIFHEAEPEFYQSVFIHPYSGKLLKIEDHLSGFFAFILDGHMHLWLPSEIGEQVIAYSVLIFVIMLITGIILWWPRNKSSRKNKFKLKLTKRTSWKRKNYDLHSVLGFYASIFAFVIAFTGLVMAFNWIGFLAYKAIGGEKSMYFIIPENKSDVKSVNDANERPIDKLIPQLKKEYSNAKSMELHYPVADSLSIYVEISYSDGVYYNSDYRFYDQSTLEEISTPSLYGAYKDANFPDIVIRMNYDFHIGAIGGILGKIIAFLISLIVASLPVSGFIYWYARKK